MSVDYVKVAFEIASKAHKGQKDKAGMDYIEHPKKVAGFVQLRTEKATAYLHDVLEDTAVTANDLLDQGIPIEVVEAVPVETAQSAACSEPEKAFVILNDATDGVAGKSVTYFIL